MVAILLTGHGEFAPGLASALEMVGGKQEAFKVLPFLEEQAAEYPQLVKAAIQELLADHGELVVFVDLMGGTPFNQAMLNAEDPQRVKVVTGTNLPMLLECCSARDFSSADELVAMALEIGRLGVDSKTLNLKNASDCDDDFDDIDDPDDEEDGI